MPTQAEQHLVITATRVLAVVRTPASVSVMTSHAPQLMAVVTPTTTTSESALMRAATTAMVQIAPPIPMITTLTPLLAVVTAIR